MLHATEPLCVVSLRDYTEEMVRCTVASAGNDHRLGAQEAPPAIISLYPGQGFESFVDSVVSGGDLLGPELEILRRLIEQVVCVCVRVCVCVCVCVCVRCFPMHAKSVSQRKTS